MDIPLQDFDFSVLDDPEFKEDSVREEIVAPLLKALGYFPTGRARIIRSRKLEHPFVQFGVTKKQLTIIPDYLMLVDERPCWVLDAKAPTEPVDAPDHVAQTYSYAIHHEVLATLYAICNGRELIVYTVTEIKPALRVHLPDLKERWQEVLRLLMPPAVLPPRPFAKDFGMHLFRLGVPATTNLTFSKVPVRYIALAEGRYEGFGMNIVSEGHEYFVSFQFEHALFEKLLSLLPPPVAAQLRVYFRDHPAACVYLEPQCPVINLTARRSTQIIENEREMFLPLNVTAFAPYVHSP